MVSTQRPACPPYVAPLRLGDHVRVAYRTCGGPATWTGSVVEVFERWGVVRISDGHRTTTATLRGAGFVQLLTPAAERLDLVHGVPTSLAHPAAGPVLPDVPIQLPAPVPAPVPARPVGVPVGVPVARRAAVVTALAA